MITLYYERAGCNDMRIFKDRIEFVDWIIRQSKLEEITIIEIKEES
mgnify:CR=1 FL=1